MLQSGELLMNRYEIVKMIGQGGMSTVYQAKDRTSQKILAIKDIRRSGKDKNQTVEQSLMAEGRMLMKLSHHRLPKIYEIIEDHDTFMLVMDYIQGESLDKVLAKKGPQNVQKTLEWGMQICEVFTYLHNQPTPIIYRDMKPANIMLQPDGQLMMIDFGTARTQKVGVAMQADTICIGTEGFAAPEQYGGLGQSDARTDIFCLGSTLYNIVTGHNPSMPPMGIHPLGQFHPSLAGSPLEEIITKCTRPDPNERYQTAAELYEDLKQASAGTYQSPGKRGKTMSFGGLRKNGGFRKQDNQGEGIITGGLSGLLQRGLEGTQQIPQTTNHQNNGTPITQKQNVGGWNQANYQVSQDYTQYQTPQNQQNQGMPKAVLVGLLVALAFLLLAVILAIAESYTAAVAVMIFALAAAVITLVFLIQSRNGNL